MRKIIILSTTIFLLFFCFTTYSQSIEALIEAAEAETDAFEQAKAYLFIADTIGASNKDLDISLTYLQKGLGICEDIDCGEWELLGKLVQAQLDIKKNNFEALEHFVFPTALEYEFKDPVFQARFYTLAATNSEDSSVFNLMYKALAITKEHAPNSRHHFDILFQLFWKNVHYNHSDSIEYYLEEQKRIIPFLKHSPSKIQHYNCLANFHTIKTQYEKTLLVLIEAQKLIDEHYPNSLLAHKSKFSLTTAYDELDKYDEAITLLIELEKEIDAIESLSPIIKNDLRIDVLTQLSGAYQKSGQTQKAYKAVDKAYDIYNEKSLLKYQHLLSIYGYYILIHSDNGRFDSALEYLPKFIELADDKYGLNLQEKGSIIFIVSYFYEESAYIPIKESYTLIPYIKAIQANNTNSYNQSNVATHKLLTWIAIHKKDRKLAADAFLQTLEAVDSFYNHKNEKISQELLVQYQSKEQEKQIEFQKEEISRKNTQVYLFIGLAIVALLLVWQIFNKNNLLKKDLENKKIIEAQASEIQEMLDAKNTFFTNIAHELKTPLTLIQEPITQLTKNPDFPKSGLQYLNIAARNGEHLKQLIHQILDLSKSTESKLNAYISTFKLKEITTSLYIDFKDYASLQKIDFQVYLEDENFLLNSDFDKLFIVLKNLLANAFKYTEQGGLVQLTAKTIDEELLIEVSDTGCGIDKKDIPFLFDRYYQTKTSKNSGTGVGLAIAKEYTTVLGGSIDVKSIKGEATKFTIKIPATISGELLDKKDTLLFSSIQIHENDIIEQRHESSRILIVDDNPDICHLLSSILSPLYQIETAGNGALALESILEQKPDLIISDLMMPIMDGNELMQKIKANAAWQDIPMIILTAKSDQSEKIKALRIGVDDYLTKPFHNEELLARISNLLKNKNHRDFYNEEEHHLNSFDKEWLQELETMTYEKITQLEFNVNALSNEMATSPSNLYRRIKSLTGLTPKQYIDSIRFHKARTLLENKEVYSIKQLSYNLGLRDEKHFARKFKKTFGKNPSEYLRG